MFKIFLIKNNCTAVVVDKTRRYNIIAHMLQVDIIKFSTAASVTIQKTNIFKLRYVIDLSQLSVYYTMPQC